MRVEYHRIRDQEAYRCRLLSAVLAQQTRDLTVYVDTGLRVGSRKDAPLPDYLWDLGLCCDTRPKPAKHAKVFGVDLSVFKTPKKDEDCVLVFEARPDMFGSQGLGRFLAGTDIAVGIGRKKCFRETSEALFCSPDEVMFNPDWFEAFVYDAASLAAMRSSFDVSDTVRHLLDTSGKAAKTGTSCRGGPLDE